MYTPGQNKWGDVAGQNAQKSRRTSSDSSSSPNRAHRALLCDKKLLKKRFVFELAFCTGTARSPYLYNHTKYHGMHRVWLAGCLRDRADSSRQQLQARPGAGQRVPGQSIPTASTAVVNFYHSWRNHRRLLQVRRVAKEMDVEKATAAWVIRDVTIGRDCEFSPARSGSDGA